MAVHAIDCTSSLCAVSMQIANDYALYFLSTLVLVYFMQLLLVQEQ